MKEAPDGDLLQPKGGTVSVDLLNIKIVFPGVGLLLYIWDGLNGNSYAGIYNEMSLSRQHIHLDSC